MYTCSGECPWVCLPSVSSIFKQKEKNMGRIKAILEQSIFPFILAKSSLLRDLTQTLHGIFKFNISLSKIYSIISRNEIMQFSLRQYVCKTSCIDFGFTLCSQQILPREGNPRWKHEDRAKKESWNYHQDEERAAQFHSKKPNVKVGIGRNNWSTSQQWFDQLVEAYEQLPEGNQRMDHHLKPFDQFLDITDKLINYSAKKSIDEHNHLILLYVRVFMFFLFHNFICCQFVSCHFCAINMRSQQVMCFCETLLQH